MKNAPRGFVILAVLVAALFLATSTTLAQDPVKVAPKNYKVLLENEHVRVLEFHGKAGDKIGMHSHPAAVLYNVSGGKSKMTASDGKVSEVDSKAGAATWNEPTTHTVEIMGPGEAHGVLVELKSHSAAPAKAPEKKAPAKKS